MEGSGPSKWRRGGSKWRKLVEKHRNAIYDGGWAMLLEPKYQLSGCAKRFGTEPDPQILSAELQIRIRILLFPSEAFKLVKMASFFSSIFCVRFKLD